MTGDKPAIQFSSVTQSYPTLWDPMDCSTPGFTATTSSQNLLKLMSIKWAMPSNHLILCHPLFLLPSVFPRIRIFSNESVFLHQLAKVLEFHLQHQSFQINIQDWFPLPLTGWVSLQSKGFSRVFSNDPVQKHQFFCAQLSSQSDSHIHTWPLEKP